MTSEGFNRLPAEFEENHRAEADHQAEHSGEHHVNLPFRADGDRRLRGFIHRDRDPTRRELHVAYPFVYLEIGLFEPLVLLRLVKDFVQRTAQGVERRLDCVVILPIDFPAHAQRAHADNRFFELLDLLFLFRHAWDDRLVCQVRIKFRTVRLVLCFEGRLVLQECLDLQVLVVVFGGEAQLPGFQHLLDQADPLGLLGDLFPSGGLFFGGFLCALGLELELALQVFDLRNDFRVFLLQLIHFRISRCLLRCGKHRFLRFLFHLEELLIHGGEFRGRDHQGVFRCRFRRRFVSGGRLRLGAGLAQQGAALRFELGLGGGQFTGALVELLPGIGPLSEQRGV